MVSDSIRKATAEFIGAFALVFIGAGAIVSTGGSDLLLIALAHGLTIGVMVSAMGHISGGHFNPAVTFGALVGRQIGARLAVVYWAAQVLGGLVAALLLLGIFPAPSWGPSHLGTPALGVFPPTNVAVGAGAGILIEAVLTFFLAFAVYGTGIDPKGTFHAVGGFAIGSTVALDIMMGGPLTGAMNPARWLGTAVASGFLDNGYVYVLGPLLGGAAAGLVYATLFLPRRK